MAAGKEEEQRLRSAALQTSDAILRIRHRAEQEILAAKEALEKMTAELALSLSLMRATLESTTDGILVVDQNGHVTDFNERFLQIWQLPREMIVRGARAKLLGVAAAKLKKPDPFLARTKEIYESVPEESFDLIEFIDGRVFERLSRIQLLNGNPVGRVWSYHDVTERNRAEETLRDETRMLELLNKTGTAIAAQLDLQSLVQIVIDSATQLTSAQFGAFFYHITDEKGDALVLYAVSGAPREAFEKFAPATGLLAPTFQGEGPIRSGDILRDPRYSKIGPHDGMPQELQPVNSFLAMPVISSSGETIGGLFFGHPERDVFTERSERLIVGVAAQAAIAIDNARLYQDAQKELIQRKQAEAERERLLISEKEARERAERETRMKDEFLATLSHELRTPLNAILGWASIIRETDKRDEIMEGLEVIERNARSQTQIIEDLLDMSRIVSGNVRLDVQRVDLVAVVKSALESVRPMAGGKEIRLTSVLDPLVGPISGDPARLQQVLWNLLTNAMKFTPKGGRVHVVLERVNSHIEISVEDTGQGITPEFLPHVFDRFRQADASTTRRQRGLGLGLAIVKNLAELHGGSVRAKSPGLDQGSTFIIALPIASARLDAEPDRRHPLGESSGEVPDIMPDLTGIRVLAVDDEADARELIKRILSRCGATVDTAGSGADALASFKKNQPHVFITDIGMPGEDGYAVIRKVRQLGNSNGGNVPAIALTAFARSEDRRRAIMSGFQMHVAKPVEPSELIAMVASLAKRTG